MDEVNGVGIEVEKANNNKAMATNFPPYCPRLPFL